jgi:uncharacterized iron-regulated protein
MMPRILPLLTLAGLLVAGCANSHMDLRIESPYRAPSTLEKGQILHAATGRLLTKAELLDYLARYPIVYVGETHDSVDDHAVELEILKGLLERLPAGVALGLEMLRRPSQPEADAYIRGEMQEKDFHRVWQRNWGNTFLYYREILRYSRDQGVPLVALNAAADLKEAVRQGLDHLEPAISTRLPEMDLDDPYHQALIKSIFGGHIKGPSQVETFYRIQVLWDETMAQTAAAYLTSPAGRDKHLLIFAGGNHVRYGLGIPRRLFRRLPLPYVIVEPYAVEIPEKKRKELMQVDLPELPMRSADIYWAVGYEDLEAQRVRLGVQIEQAKGNGTRVLSIAPGSPAAKAGIKVGDVIVAVDGEPIGEVFDLTYQVGLHKPGDTGKVEVVRNGQRLTLEVLYEVVRHGQ